MAEFVLKNAIVEAVQYDGNNRLQIENFAGNNILYTAEKEPEIYIRTTEGILNLMPSVWILKLKDGRLLIMDKDEFNSYELR